VSEGTNQPSADALADDPDFVRSVQKAAEGIDRAREQKTGAESVAEILDKADEPVAPVGEASSDKKTEKKADAPKPTPPAKGLVKKTVEDLRKRYRLISDDSFVVYRYDAGAWSALSEAHLLHLVHALRPGLSASSRRDVVATLKADCFVHRPKWGRVAEYEIAVSNGVLDLRSMTLRKHSPDDMLERVLPVRWNPDATAPKWESALATWFPPAADGGRSTALQEFFGYICTSHAKYKQALLLYGDSDTGKSVPPMVAKMLVGHDFSCQLGVEDMDDPQRRSVLKGKALNIITELSAEALIADGGFKTLVSTEEPVLLDEKYKAPEMYISTAKFMISTNNLPRLNDHTSATFNRLLIVPFDRVLTAAEQDRGLLAALEHELEGILRWAAEGAARLFARGGQWPTVEAARSVLDGYKDELNPVRQFLLERALPDASALIPLHNFANVFNQWAAGSRRRTVKEVGRLLRGAGYGKAIRVARFEKRPITCLAGFKFAENNPTLLYASANQPDDGAEIAAVTSISAASTANTVRTDADDLDAEGETVR
jgi:P4 family phage/plasmid primase-like protien